MGGVGYSNRPWPAERSGKKENKRNMKKFVYIILAGVLWGSLCLFAHALTPYGFTNAQLTMIRGTVAFLCMAVYALIRDRRLFRAGPVELLRFIALGATLFSTSYLYFIAMERTSTGTAAVLMYMAPVYVMLFSCLFLGEKFSALKGGAVALMLAGSVFMSGVIGGMKFDTVGILIGLLSGVTFAAYNILTKISVQKGSDPVSATVYGFLFMAVFAAFFAQPVDLVRKIGAADLRAVPWLLGIGVVACVMPFFLYTVAMKSLSAGTASVLAIVDPLSATLFGFALLHEKLDAFSVVGIVLILSAVVLLGVCQIREGTEERKEQEIARSEK